MIGFYNYTVVLTYLSLFSAGMGIFVSLSGKGHPYLGVFFLLFCGLCDAFDGKVARTKKNRTKTEQNFGIQIDSLSDIVAFGVLPACIGAALVRHSVFVCAVKNSIKKPVASALSAVVFTLFALYILAAMIRLAYFNVKEEERQAEEGGVLKYYTGLPVTSAALIFPAIMLLQYITISDMTPLFLIAVIITGFLFLSKMRIKKPGMTGILIMVGIGAVEFVLLLIGKILK